MREYYIHRGCQIDHRVLSSLYRDHLPDCGFFVDVGAYDGVTGSNTVYLAQHDWSGLMIEPLPEMFQKCRDYYKENDKVEVINQAMSDTIGSATLYRADCISTICEKGKAFERAVRSEDYCGGVTVSCNTLNAVLEARNIDKIDMLSLDAEGVEARILSKFDIAKYKPAICIVEVHAKEAILRDDEALAFIEKYFASANYTLAYSDTTNNIYLHA